MISFTFQSRLKMHYLNQKGFILPYTLLLLVIILSLAFASKDLFISKYRYLSNIKSIHEKNISISHTILVEVERGPESSRHFETNFGEITSTSNILTPQEVQLEVLFEKDKKVFLPTRVVYNRETKQIISWE